MQKNKLYELVTLICRCSFVFFGIYFIASFIGSTLVFFKLGIFNFDWKEAIFISIKKGAIIGFTLGVGLWIKVRLQERKNRKESAK